MKIFDFEEQLVEGEEAEAYLDSEFSKFAEIKKVGMDLQKKGIDRAFRMDGKIITVEYKADRRATLTGNAFIETISVSTTFAEGWAKKTQADWIVYFLPQELKVYMFPVKEMRKRLNDWRKTYPTRKAQNKGYYSQGLLVPLTEIETFSKVIQL